MSYLGQRISFPLGKAGVHTDDVPQDLAPGELTKAVNIDLSRGIVQKAAGSRKWNSAQLPAGIVQAIDWSPDTVSQRVTAACTDGNLYTFKNPYRYTQLTRTDSILPLTPTNQGSFCTFGHVTTTQKVKLLYLSGNDMPQVVEGNATSSRPITKPAVEWVTGNYPTFGIVFRERLFVLGADPHTILASTISDQEDFQTIKSNANPSDYVLPFVVFPGEGERLVTGWVFRGKLFIAKYPSGIYMLNDADSNWDNWYFQKVSSTLGCDSVNSAVETVEDMYLGNQFGSISSLQAAFQLGDVKFGDIVSNLRCEDMLNENVNRSLPAVRFNIFHKDSKTAYFSYASHDSSKANRIVALDLNLQKPKLSILQLPAFNSALIMKGREKREVVAFTRDDGYIYTMDSPTRDTELEFRLPQTTLGFDGNKVFDFLEVEAEHTGLWKLYCDVFLDDTFSETINFDMSQGSVLRATADVQCFQLDKDRLMGRQTRSQRKRLHGRGRRISLRFYSTNSVGQNFKITQVTIHLRVGNEDQRGK